MGKASSDLGPKKKAAARRLADHMCAEAKCPNRTYTERVNGTEHTRCWQHLLQLRTQVKRMHDARKASGLCRCGKDRVPPDMKKCFGCTFGIKSQNVEDWVELFEKHPRAWNKTGWR
jgi:hypothetical protein